MSNIVKTPGTCGGRARIANTRIPVWLIVLWVEKHNCTVEDIADMYPYITKDLIREALEYAAGVNRPEINQDILDQEEEQDWW